MEHCYIFDYTNAKLYHTTIPEDVEDVTDYLSKLLGVGESSIYFMCTNEELKIEEL